MKYFKIAPVLIIMSLLAVSCTKNFQETNTRPDQPATTTVQPLMNHIISTLILQWQEQASAHNDWYYPVTQLGGDVSGSGYVLANGVNDIWNDYYSTLQNINNAQDLISAATDKESMNNVQAILYILKAYKTFRVTDQFGDIPYFDAGKAYTGDTKFYRPKYDAQADIYKDLLSSLDWASKNIKTDASPVTAAGKPYYALGSFDTFFKGNMKLWLEFANSLRLRYAIQMYEKDPTDATPIVQDVIGNNLPVINEGEDVGMWPMQLNGLDIASRPWSFNSHKFLRMSTTVWDMVSDGPDSANIFDPRTVLFFETNQAGKWAPYTIGSTASDAVNPYKTARDNNYNDKDGAKFSPFNYHLIRDEFYIPELIQTNAEVHFLKAEAYARGIGVGKDMAMAQTEYFAGITSSVNFWYKIAHNTNTTNDAWSSVAPPTPNAGQMTDFLANPKVAFTGTDDAKLNKIYAQEWLSYFREPWLAFNLWRRTGRTPREGNPAAYSNFNRLPYPNIESIDNADNYNAQISKIGSNGSDVKVWWMP